MKNEKFSKFILFLNQKTNYTFGTRKYNWFFDLKTKLILKIFHFSFFSFIIKIEKLKNFLKFIFWFEIKKGIRKY